MKILYIVKRYGLVGGMERYVWETTRELAISGHHVEVVCEQCHSEIPEGILVHELGKIAERPRWLSHLRFNWKVKSWLEQNPHDDFLIHSHERLGVHDLTTFHGTPFANVLDKPLWKILSLRVAMNLYLEWRELSTAKIIVPNSSAIRSQLANYYPKFRNKLVAPITPGVTVSSSREIHTPSATGGVIAFVGCEWKRKGLPFAVKVIAELRRSRPELELWVIGPKAEDVQHLFKGWNDGYRLLGWQTDTSYLHNKIDVIIHPAVSEAYGMVVSEAMSAQIPVVISSACGVAKDVKEESGKVVSLQAPIDDWVTALQTQLQRTDLPPAFSRSWAEIACAYESAYRQCKSKISSEARNADLQREHSVNLNH